MTDKEILIEKEVQDQLDAFKKDNSFLKDYEKYDLLKPQVLLRMFKYYPSEDVSEELKHEIEIEMKVPTRGGGGMMKNKKEKQSISTYARLYPYGKVLATGDLSELNPKLRSLKPGDVVTLLDEEFFGDEMNPDFIKALQATGPDNGKLINMGVPPMINKLSMLDKYIFLKNKLSVEPTEDDRKTFLLPTQKLISIER